MDGIDYHASDSKIGNFTITKLERDDIYQVQDAVMFNRKDMQAYQTQKDLTPI